MYLYLMSYLESRQEEKMISWQSSLGKTTGVNTISSFQDESNTIEMSRHMHKMGVHTLNMII